MKGWGWSCQNQTLMPSCIRNAKVVWNVSTTCHSPLPVHFEESIRTNYPHFLTVAINKLCIESDWNISLPLPIGSQGDHYSQLDKSVPTHTTPCFLSNDSQTHTSSLYKSEDPVLLGSRHLRIQDEAKVPQIYNGGMRFMSINLEVKNLHRGY